MLDSADYQLLQRVLALYASQYRPSQIEPAPQAGFSGARVWKLSTAVGPFALRQWPATGLDRARLLGLHRLLEHIRAQQVLHVAVPVPSSAGASLVVVDNRLWQLEPWLPGAADYFDEPSDTKLAAALTALAEWHQAAATFTARDEEREWFATHAAAASPGIAERLRTVASWTQQRLRTTAAAVQAHAWREFGEVAAAMLEDFQRAAPNIAGELQMTSQLRFRLQPCLRDIWHDHVLFEGNRVTGLIDASACRCETVAADIARLVGSLVGDDAAGWERALAAYQAARPLGVEERGAVAVFDRSGVLLSGMTWVHWIACEGRRVAEPERVLDRIRDIAGRLRELAR